MSIKIPLLFHFNQHLNQFAEIASKVCYIGLLETLLKAPTQANIHISGTLIQSLKWLDPEPIRLIREGLKSGKFEILGSTHSQNIPYSTNDRDNREQIKLHRKIIEDTFDVSPSTFWNPERCWRQSLLEMIAEAGYKTITIEDPILRSAGIKSAPILSTAYKGQTIKVVRDDEQLKHLFNFAAWFGNKDQLFHYLEEKIEEFPLNTQYLAYAEDAEAMGLWGYNKGIIPNQTWDQLADLLQAIESRAALETVHFSDLPEATTHLPILPDGSAAWMDASLGNPNLPYHESGFTNWFDYNENSEKVNFFRQYYDNLREPLDAFQPETKAAAALIDLARHAYLTHQYEFGCIGIGGKKSRAWRGAAASIPLLKLATNKMSSGIESFEIEHEDFQLLSKPAGSAILTSVGGRVLFWADTSSGRLMVGNPGCVVPGEYNGLGVPPDIQSFPQQWLPNGKNYDKFIVNEPPPSRMRRFLADWVWDKHPDDVSLAVREMKLEGEPRNSLPAQQGAFFDEISFEGGETIFGKSTRMDWTGTGYRSAEIDGLVVEKKCSITESGLRMAYRLTTVEAEKVNIKISAELAGDYAAVLREGRNAIDFMEGAAISIHTNDDTLRLAASVPVKRTFHKEGLLCLIVGIEFDLSITERASKAFTIDLIRS